MNIENKLTQLRIEPENRTTASPRTFVTRLIIVTLSIVIACMSFMYIDSKNTAFVNKAHVSAEPKTLDEPKKNRVPDVDSVLDASGYVIARLQADISPRVGGVVKSLHFEVGQIVEKGQRLAELDSWEAKLESSRKQTELEVAKYQFKELEAQLKQQKAEIERLQNLVKSNFVSKATLEKEQYFYQVLTAKHDAGRESIEVIKKALEISKKRLDEYTIYAPFKGVITHRSVEIGEYVRNGAFAISSEGIGKIVSLDSLEVEVDVAEKYLHRLSVGQEVNISLNAFPDTNIKGSVRGIVPNIERAKATAKVKISLSDYDRQRIIPNMGVRAKFSVNKPLDKKRETRDEK